MDRKRQGYVDVLTSVEGEGFRGISKESYTVSTLDRNVFRELRGAARRAVGRL